MKLIILPTDLLDRKPYSSVISPNKKLYGWFMMRTILSVSKEFKIGDWIRNGCKGVPYSYWFALDDLFHFNNVKTEQEQKEYFKFLERCSEYSVMFYEKDKDELNVRIEFPDMMKYVDETQLKETCKNFGVGKLPQYAIEEIISNGGELSRETLEHIKNNNKTNNNINNLSNYKEDNYNPYDKSSSPQAPSDKGSDEDLEYWQRVGQANVDEMNRIEKDIN